MVEPDAAPAPAPASASRPAASKPSDHDRVAPTSDPAPFVPALRTINSTDLFAGAREVLIRHDDQTYRLRVTRNGKLILIK